MTPSGGWVPAVVAGDTGIGLSQRMQSFVLNPDENRYNVVEPGKRPRVTLTPGMALRDGKPLLSFAVQGGDPRGQVPVTAEIVQQLPLHGATQQRLMLVLAVDIHQHFAEFPQRLHRCRLAVDVATRATAAVDDAP